MIHSLLQKLLGDQNEKALKKLLPIVPRINAIEEEYQQLTNEQLQAKTLEFRERIQTGESIDDLLPEAFAAVKNACRRLVDTAYVISGIEKQWNMVPYDVQLLGGIVLHKGNISEMKTGEGKTLTCTLPIYLNALAGKGVHLVTVNDYLARRDAEWMGKIYEFLGLSVGVIYHDMPSNERKTAYQSDITYGTNNEFGFDYLRDNMVSEATHMVQRDLHFAIVDEVDSILIDEARTPLIISAPAEESTDKYKQYSLLIPRLVLNEDYNVDEKQRAATLTEAGIKKMEEWLGMKNIYTEAGFLEVHHIEQALRAQACYQRDKDYVVEGSEVVIVDEFTGRLMPGRRYSEGLHQAIEAKEQVEVKRESKTLATITFQNYFRLYQKIAGMTGTAMTEAEEFERIYGLRTIAIPTNVAVVRKDMGDRIYKNEHGKFRAVVKEIAERHSTGQPLLVGTISIEKSEVLSRLLEKEHVPHRVLNAKQHEREAEIVALAGRKGAVTIATNMAGRGTDIELGPEVRELGGLHILGTERHESRRIDNQLRGRAGRQGDLGSTQFYVSMEDELMRLFGSDRVKSVMDRLGIPDDQSIENIMITRSIESAQKRVEGHNFDIRKHVLEYDDVMNKHREIIYSRRKKILNSENVHSDITRIISEEVEAIVRGHVQADGTLHAKEIQETLHAIHDFNSPLAISADENIETAIPRLQEAVLAGYEQKLAQVPEVSVVHRFERIVYLRAIDGLWVDHLTYMKHIRESVALRGYGQRDPLMEYKNEAYIALQKLLGAIRTNTVTTLFKAQLAATAVQQLQGQRDIRRTVTNESELEGQTGGAINVMRTRGPQAGGPRTQGMAPMKQETVIKGDQINRNEPCPCGSGKKYKKCHGA